MSAGYCRCRLKHLHCLSQHIAAIRCRGSVRKFGKSSKTTATRTREGACTRQVCPVMRGVEKDMRRIALVVFTVGSLAMASQAMAGGRYGGYGGYHGGRGYHGGGGGNVAAALFGGAILGVVAGSIISNANSREVVVERPVYVEPARVYVEPSPVYVEPAPCYDSYRGVYVQCGSVSYAPQPVYREPAQQSEYYNNDQSNYAQRQDAPPRAQQSSQQYQESQYQESQYQGSQYREPQYQAPLQNVRAPARQPIPSVYADGSRPVGDRFDGPSGGR